MLKDKNQGDRVQYDENFNALLNIMPDPVAVLDSKGCFLELSKKACDILGYSKQELIGKNVFTMDILANKAKAITTSNFAKRMLGVRVSPYIIEVLTRDGKKVEFELNARKIHYRNTPADLVVFRDITERQQMKEAIHQEQERFQAIVSSTGDWIWETDAEGKFTYSSPTVEQIIGYRPEEMVGKRIIDLVPTENREKVASTMSKIFAKKERYSDLSVQVIDKNGKTVYMEKTAIPIIGLNGELLGYRGLNRNVSERRELERKVMKSERFAAVGELAAMIAHDLRNPLQGIANATYFLKNKLGHGCDQTTKEIFGLLEEAVEYSNKVVSDLLEYSREIRLFNQITSVGALVSDSLVSSNFPPDIQVTTDIPSDSQIEVDYDKIKRVFVNLIKNSVDAMPTGGKLSIVAKEEGENMKFIFSDTGTGMTKETLEKLWTPLFTTKAKGMGFGLSICKRVIEAHGGKISVESTLHQGTTFTITVPSKPKYEGGVEVWVDSQAYLSSTTIKQ